jgi:hypothetical protein
MLLLARFSPPPFPLLQLRIKNMQGARRSIQDAARDGDAAFVKDYLLAHPACLGGGGAKVDG